MTPQNVWQTQNAAEMREEMVKRFMSSHPRAGTMPGPDIMSSMLLIVITVDMSPKPRPDTAAQAHKSRKRCVCE